MKRLILPLLLAVSTVASAVTINNPKNGSTVTSPFVVSGSSATCNSQPVIQIGYSIDGGADVLSPQAKTLDLSATASPGGHVVHVEVRGKSGSACEADVDITVSQATPQTSTGTTYYLSPTGKDSNSGTSASAPWLTPNHAVSCGDTLIMAAGAYNGGNFSDNFGKVSCAAGNNVAWLKCATAFACSISGGDGVQVDQSYWGVQGLVVSTSTAHQPCFAATPDYSGGVKVHHIIFANNVANGCQAGGFIVYNEGSNSADYVNIVGNVAYNAAQGSASCASGISVFEPSASDTASGTHIYVAGNISYGTVDPDPCDGRAPTDGEGIIFDTINAFSYGGQIVAANNLLVGNGGRGLQALTSSKSPIYFVHNTVYGNNTDRSEASTICAEMVVNQVSKSQTYSNLLETTGATACADQTSYGAEVNGGNSTDALYDTWLYSPAGDNLKVSGLTAGPNNIIGTNPVLSNPIHPGAPNCSGKANVPACMAGMIADYKPTDAAAKAYGYQTPSSTPDSDPLFPSWLCNVNLPTGLVTEGCAE